MGMGNIVFLVWLVGAANPLSGRGIVDARQPYSEVDAQELEDLEKAAASFSAQAAEYRQATRDLLEYKYKQKREILFNSYERLIEQLETEQRRRRDTAIEKFEAFAHAYSDDPRYTPDALFRLAELYFERSYDEYFGLRQAYEKAFAQWTPQSGTPEPEEPRLHYEPTIAMMQRLITEFGDYRLVDGAYYLLGYCLAEQGEDERAVDVYQEMVARLPNSHFSPEVWTRIGEYYFDANELNRALNAYTQVLGHPDSPFYDKAVYKLAWTHYRLADPDRAPEEFQKAVDTFVELLDFNARTKAAGEERGGDLRAESIKYISICYADEKWGGLEKLLTYLAAHKGAPYEREVISALGDIYFDQTRFDLAMGAYQIAADRFPTAREAPETQDKIVQALERNRDFVGAAKARERLSANFSPGTPWFAANKNDAKAVTTTDQLIQKSIYSAAIFHHRQAQAHKEGNRVDAAKAEYAQAALAYGDYLTRYPHDHQLYELQFYYAECLYYSLQFDAAAVQYAKVRNSDEDTKFRHDAAFSAILSLENQAKIEEADGKISPAKVMTSSDRPEGYKPREKPLPELKEKIVTASDRFALVSPQDDKLPKVLYKAAEIFYVYDHFKQARERFAQILAAYPADEVAEFASNLIIESYLAEKDFPAVEAFSRQLLTGTKVPGKKSFANDLVKFKTGAMFKIAEDLDTKSQWEQAAGLYVKILDENPTTQFADSALNNAAVDYEKVKRYESASKLYERLVNEHPKSPLADGALFRVGLNAERFFDFDKAISAYLALVDRYPKSERRADAIYNVALSLENTQDYEKAAAQYQRYCQLFPTRDDAPKVCFRAGSVLEKLDDWKRVITTYSDFAKKFRHSTKDADRIIEADLRIAKAWEHLNGQKEAQKAFAEVVAAYKRSPDTKSAPFAAEAQFQLVERELKKFADEKIEGNSNQQKVQIPRKAEDLKKVEDAYKQILVFKQIDWSLASLFRIGQLYQNFYETLLTAPCPQDIKRAGRQLGATAEEVCTEYQVLLEERATKLSDKAVEAYERTINYAREFQVVNTWTKQTLLALNKMRGSKWPLDKEGKSFVDVVAIAPPPILGDHGQAVAVAAPATPTPDATPAPAKKAD